MGTGLIAGVPVFGLYTLIEKSLETQPDLVRTVASIGYVLTGLTVCSYLPTRLCLILPARALDHDTITASHIWARTKRRFWPLYLGSVACAMIPTILTAVLPLGPEEAGSIALYSAVSHIIWLIAGMVGVTFLSLAYRQLFPEMFKAPFESPPG